MVEERSVYVEHWCTDRRNWSALEKKPVPVPIYPLQIPCKLDWDRTRPSAAKEQLLTTKSVRYNLRNL